MLLNKTGMKGVNLIIEFFSSFVIRNFVNEVKLRASYDLYPDKFDQTKYSQVGAFQFKLQCYELYIIVDKQKRTN